VTRHRLLHPVAVLVVAALVPALALFGLWRWAAGEADADEPPPPGTAVAASTPAAPMETPLLSWRRTPGVLSRHLNEAAFETAVADFGATLDDTSCVSVSLDGIPVGAQNETIPVIPASNQKLLVAAAALDVLGADHRFTTEVRSVAPENGVVAGDLYLVGGGDPVLVSRAYPNENDRYPVFNATSLDRLADRVAAAGITRVDGDVVGDGARYDDEWYVPSWSQDVRVLEGGPYDALMVNDSRVTGDEQRADDPAEGAARELVRLLEERGIDVGGSAAAGAAPGATETIAAVSSRRLPAIIAEMLMTSDNNTAELLVKEMGVAASGRGTREDGLAAMQQSFERSGLPTGGLTLADGSGLSNDNRLTCALLDAVLADAGLGSPIGAGLPVAGESGTLADVFVDTPVAGRMRAKTGTLGNPPFDADPPAVKALSGLVPVRGGGVIEFALVHNGSGPLADQSVYRPVWDQLAAVVGDYPTGPTPDDLAPE
jgi:D-alanyl-D-alanine carboxypeptidase/D-alanyl-D-alanine-endopeptidase (penicillin-binding protein 4)